MAGFQSSPKEKFIGPEPCQQFTAIGEVVGKEPYQFEMSPDFMPYRRDIRYLEAKNAPIRPLLDGLSFIKDKSKWGYAFRFGHLEISSADFELIATDMLGFIP